MKDGTTGVERRDTVAGRQPDEGVQDQTRPDRGREHFKGSLARIRNGYSTRRAE